MITYELEIPIKGEILRANLFLPNIQGLYLIFLEATPYRKHDYLGSHSLELYGYLTSQGYAGCLLDIRGTGRSDGSPPSAEYTKQEIDDIIEVINYLIVQPYSSGRIVIWGLSWSGTNALHVASRNHPAVIGTVAMMCTSTLFTDDIYYIDGNFHMDEYEVEMDIDPTLPQINLEFNQNRFYFQPWTYNKIRHQTNDDYWLSRSIDLRKISSPVLFVGGLFDGYRDIIDYGVYILRQRGIPATGIIGPWAHSYPYNGGGGPAVEIRDIILNWIENPSKYNGFLAYIRKNNAICPDTGYWISANQLGQYYQYELGSNIILTESKLDNMPEKRIFQVPSEITGQEAGLWWGDIQGKQNPNGCLVISLLLEPACVIAGIIYFVVDVNSSVRSKLCIRMCDNDYNLITGGSAPVEICDNWNRITIRLHLTTWTIGNPLFYFLISQELWPMLWPNRKQGSLLIKDAQVSIPIITEASYIDLPKPLGPVCGSRLPEQKFSITDNHAIYSKSFINEYQDYSKKYSVNIDIECSPIDISIVKWEGIVSIEYITPSGRHIIYSVVLTIISNIVNYEYRCHRRYIEDGKIIAEVPFFQLVPRLL